MAGIEPDDGIEAAARVMMAGTPAKTGRAHAAHFAVDLWLLRERGEAAARTGMPDMLRLPDPG